MGYSTWSQGHIHTSNMLGRGVSMVVAMPHVIGNVLEWFQHAGHLASLSWLLYCCTCCTAVLVHIVHRICCTSTAVQPVQLDTHRSAAAVCCTSCTAVLAVLLYLMYCCTAGAQIYALGALSYLPRTPCAFAAAKSPPPLPSTCVCHVLLHKPPQWLRHTPAPT